MLCSSETLLVWKGNTFLVPNKNKKQLLCMRYSTLHVLSSFRNGPCVFSILYQPNALWLPTLFMLLYVWFLCEKWILFPEKVVTTNPQLSVHLIKASEARILYWLKKRGKLCIRVTTSFKDTYYFLFYFKKQHYYCRKWTNRLCSLIFHDVEASNTRILYFEAKKAWLCPS